MLRRQLLAILIALANLALGAFTALYHRRPVGYPVLAVGVFVLVLVGIDWYLPSAREVDAR
jgi:hypothetical protein